jgi:hypothetical protein
MSLRAAAISFGGEATSWFNEEIASAKSASQ